MDVIEAHISGPTDFGPGAGLVGSSGAGDAIGVDGGNGQIWVPDGYVSGSALSSGAVWHNQTFASLGVTPGTYVWIWGQGPTADSFTLSIGVPEPATWAMMICGMLGLGAVLRRRRMAAAA